MARRVFVTENYFFLLDKRKKQKLHGVKWGRGQCVVFTCVPTLNCKCKQEKILNSHSIIFISFLLVLLYSI